MDFLKKNKWFLLLGAALLALMILAVVLIKTTAKDNGFVLTPNGQPVTWVPGNLPVTLYVDPSAIGWRDLIDKAAQDWNSVVGRTVFTVVSTDGFGRSKCTESGVPGDVAVFVSEGQTDITGEGGHALLHWNSSLQIRCVDLVLARNAPKDLWAKIVAHELGHTLGLAHDEIDSSIMYYGGKALRWGMDAVTDKDRALLRQTYR